MVRESEYKSEDPGFDPLARQGEVQLFCSSNSRVVNSCAGADSPEMKPGISDVSPLYGILGLSVSIYLPLKSSFA